MDIHYLHRTYQAMKLAEPVPVTAGHVYFRLTQKNFQDRLKKLVDRPGVPSYAAWDGIKNSLVDLAKQLQSLQTLCEDVTTEEIAQAQTSTELDEAVVDGLWGIQRSVHALIRKVEQGGYLETDMDWGVLREVRSEIYALASLRLQIFMGSDHNGEQNPSQEGFIDVKSTVSDSGGLTICLSAPEIAEWSTNDGIGRLVNPDPLEHMGSERDHRSDYVASNLTKLSKNLIEARYFKEQLYAIARVYADPDPNEEEDPYRKAKHDAISTLADLVNVSTAGSYSQE
jgi:hypothetical protein